MAEPADYNEAGEIFKKSMQESLAHLDKVAEEATKAHEVAIDLQIAAKEEIKRIEREAHLISEAYIDKHHKEYETRIRKEIQFSMIKKLILNGLESVKIMRLFEIERSVIADAWFELGFDKLGDHVANVGYEEQGRSGNVVFYREDINLRFWYEFGSGLTLAFINVPKEENWTSITGLPLDDRLPILNFIGERVVRDRAPGYRYEIKEDSINIIPDENRKQFQMNKIVNYLIGPELLWIFFYIVVVVIIKATHSPVKSMDSFWVNTAFIIPLVLIPLTFGLYFIPGVIRPWLLLRIWIVGIIGGHYVLSKSLGAHSEQGPGVGTAYIMGIGIVIIMLIAGSIFAKIKF